MIFAMGVTLHVTYFAFLVGAARVLRETGTDFVMLAFFLWSALGAVVVVRLQSRLERFFIGRYVSRNPGSGWNVTTGSH